MQNALIASMMRGTHSCQSRYVLGFKVTNPTSFSHRKIYSPRHVWSFPINTQPETISNSSNLGLTCERSSFNVSLVRSEEETLVPFKLRWAYLSLITEPLLQVTHPSSLPFTLMTRMNSNMNITSSSYDDDLGVPSMTIPPSTPPQHPYDVGMQSPHSPIGCSSAPQDCYRDSPPSTPPPFMTGSGMKITILCY